MRPDSSSSGSISMETGADTEVAHVLTSLSTILKLASDIQFLGGDWFSEQANHEWSEKVLLLEENLDFFTRQERTEREKKPQGIKVDENLVDNRILQTLKRAEESLKTEERKLRLHHERTNSDRCCGIFAQICALVAKVTISLPGKLDMTLGEVLNTMATLKSIFSPNTGEVVALYRKIFDVASGIQGLAGHWFSVTATFESKVKSLMEWIEFYEQDEGRHVHKKLVDWSSMQRLKRAEESLKIELRKIMLHHERISSDRCFGVYSKCCVLVAKVSTLSLPEKLDMTLGKVLNTVATFNTGDVVDLYRKIFYVASGIQALRVDWFSVTARFELKMKLLMERREFYEQDEGRHVYEKPVDKSIVQKLKRAEKSLKIELRKILLHHERISSDRCFGVYSKCCVLVAKVSTLSLPEKLEMILVEVMNVMETSEFDSQAETADWRSVAGMLKRVRSLETADAKVLLFLIHACKVRPTPGLMLQSSIPGEAFETSVPGEVLRSLYYATRPLNTFSVSIDELCKTKLVHGPVPSTLAPGTWKDMERIDKEVEEYMFSGLALEHLSFKIRPHDIVYGDWSMRPLVKRCITDVDEIMSVINPLFGDDQFTINYERISEREAAEKEKEKEKLRVTVALCNLYFDSAVIKQVVNNRATSASDSVHPDVMLKERWRSIEPLIWLLDQPTDEAKWEESNISCVRKVFLKYIYENQLDAANISVLLRLTEYPMAPLATLATIANIFSNGESSLFNHDSRSILEAIFDLLNSKELDFQESASTTLLHITRRAGLNDQPIIFGAKMPAILALLVRSIQDFFCTPPRSSLELSQNAIRIFWNLGRDETLQLTICNEDQALASLVRCLSTDDSNPLQECAAGALWRLACGREATKLKIVKERGALAGLVKCLSKDEKATLQECAAGAFMSLATGGDLIKSEILSEDGSLQAIVKSLSMRHNVLEKNAATILKNLAFGGESIIYKIVENDGTLAGLVKSLSKDDIPQLQEVAASALLNLATGGEAIRFKILTQKGVLESLVRSLTLDNPSVVESAARALWSLTYGGKSTKLKISKLIVNQDGALECLVQALSKDGEPVLQQYVALVLGNIATTQVGTKAIVGTERALASLVKSLSKKDNPSLQRNAAGVLWILAAQGKINQVGNEEGAIAGLVEFVSEHEDLNVSRNAIGALLALAAGGKISDPSKGALERFLSKDHHPNLQHKATRDLFDQAIGGESAKSKIREALKVWNGDKAHGTDAVAPELDPDKNALQREKSKEAIIHCALYYDQVSTHILVEAAIKHARHAHEVIHSNDPINDQRRKTLDLLIPLLDEPKEEEEHNRLLDQSREESNQRTETYRAHCVRQVFLTYVSEGQLDGKILDLLKLAPLVALKAIVNIFEKEEGPLLNSNSQKLLDDVKHLLGSIDDSQRGVKEAASEALLHIFRKCMKEDPALVLKNKRGSSGMLLASIQDSLVRKQSDRLASNAAKILCLLGYSLIYTPK